MKDLREVVYILEIMIYRDRSKRLLGLSPSTYIDKVLKQFSMEESKKVFLTTTLEGTKELKIHGYSNANF